MHQKLVIVILLLLSTHANAVWLNTSGTVESITTYGHTNTVLIKLSVNGTNVEECSNKTYFAISNSISEEARARMYSMFLAAQATGRIIRVSYDDVGGCEPWDSNPSAYRKIDRLQ